MQLAMIVRNPIGYFFKCDLSLNPVHIDSQYGKDSSYGHTKKSAWPIGLRTTTDHCVGVYKQLLSLPHLPSNLLWITPALLQEEVRNP